MGSGALPAEAYTSDPDFTALEMQAVSSLVTDLVKIIESMVPGALDHTLRVQRLRLQQLETQQGDPAIDNEATIRRFKIAMLERGLGRSADQLAAVAEAVGVAGEVVEFAPDRREAEN